MRRRIARPAARAGLFAFDPFEPIASGNLTGTRTATCYGGGVASPELATTAGLTVPPCTRGKARSVTGSRVASSRLASSRVARSTLA
jgi:hypothetical protein